MWATMFALKHIRTCYNIFYVKHITVSRYIYAKYMGFILFKYHVLHQLTVRTEDQLYISRLFESKAEEQIDLSKALGHITTDILTTRSSMEKEIHK